MRSQTKWGIFFIFLGLSVLIITRLNVIAAVYAAILILLGISLIIFRKREEIIDGV